VECDRYLAGNQNVFLSSKYQILQATGATVEQRSLHKHLPREKIIGTKTRIPSTASHLIKIHPNSTIGGTKHQTTIGRKATTGINPLETKI
jgi:hypothetical protein